MGKIWITYAVPEMDGSDDFSWREIESGELSCLDDAVAWLAKIERYERSLEERASTLVVSEE